MSNKNLQPSAPECKRFTAHLFTTPRLNTGDGTPAPVVSLSRWRRKKQYSVNRILRKADCFHEVIDAWPEEGIAAGGFVYVKIGRVRNGRRATLVQGDTYFMSRIYFEGGMIRAVHTGGRSTYYNLSDVEVEGEIIYASDVFIKLPSRKGGAR